MLLLRLKNFVVREVNIVLDYINVFPTFNDDLESLWNEINCVDIVERGRMRELSGTFWEQV